MKLYSALAAIAVLALTTSAQAVQLVVMSTNSNTGVAGQKAFLIGVRIGSTDLATAGPNATLSIHNLTFTGNGTVPVQGVGSNKNDIQMIQSAFIDNASAYPPTSAGLSAAGRGALYQDSWWFNSSDGLLTGAIDDIGNSGTVTTTTGGQVGPSLAVGASGVLWTPNGSAGIVFPDGQNTTGHSMQYSGTYGPSGSNTLDGPTLAPLFSGGFLTVPIAQIVATGDIGVPGSYPQLTGSFITLGNKNYYNGPGFISFSESGPPIVFYLAPEPGTLALAGLGALGLLLARRRRRI